MKLVDVGSETESTFLRCLHDEVPEDPRVMLLRRRWFDAHRDKGLGAKVLVLETGEVVALCQYMPIERTHFIGKHLLAVLCICVHGYEHHVGNRQGNGYGRHILESIEAYARGRGFAGIAAWGMDFPHWNPVSFYEHMGYARVDKDGMAVLVWKPFCRGVSPPRLLRQVRRPVTGSERVSVMAFVNGWCTGACSQCIAAREAVRDLEDIVDHCEVNTSDPEVLHSWGICDGIYVNGEPHRPYERPWTSDVLRQDLIELAGA